MIFEDKNWLLTKLCQIVLRTLNPKIFFDMLLRHRASEHLTFPLKWAKLNFLFNIFKGCTWNRTCSLDWLKAKNEDKLKKCSTFDYIKNRFAHLEKIKKILKNFNLEFSFLRLFFEVKGRYIFANFQKILILRSPRFFQSENFALHALCGHCKIHRFFGI